MVVPLRTRRRDGAATQERILNAACRVFAEKGFDAATTADICAAAQCNIAAINYYFGDKNSLYVAAWAQAFQASLLLYPIDGGVPPDRPVEERFRGHVDALVKRITDSGKLGQFHRMQIAEAVHPTGLVDKPFEDLRSPNRAHMHGLLRELLGPAASHRNVVLCEASVLGQCQAVDSRWRGIDSVIHEDLSKLSPENLVEHIVTFSLAGIAKLRHDALRVRRSSHNKRSTRNSQHTNNSA